MRRKPRSTNKQVSSRLPLSTPCFRSCMPDTYSWSCRRSVSRWSCNPSRLRTRRTLPMTHRPARLRRPLRTLRSRTPDTFSSSDRRWVWYLRRTRLYTVAERLDHQGARHQGDHRRRSESIGATWWLTEPGCKSHPSGSPCRSDRSPAPSASCTQRSRRRGRTGCVSKRTFEG